MMLHGIAEASKGQRAGVSLNLQNKWHDLFYIYLFMFAEKEMATQCGHVQWQSSVLAWRIPGMAEPGGLPPTGSHRV